MSDHARRVRRAPPAFRPVAVRHVERLGPRMVRVRLGGDALQGFEVAQPAASVRLLLPPPGGGLVLPQWTGNEFRLPDGTRAPIRTFTPLRAHPDRGELDVEVVDHGGGLASAWAAEAAPGAPAALSGPGRGYDVPADAGAFLLAGDETALPAIGQLLPTLPAGVPVHVHVEIACADGRLPLDAPPGATVQWHELPPGAPPGEALVGAVAAAPLSAGTHVWVAGEAAAVQRIRRHLFEQRGVPRTRAVVRGYWKHGRSGDGGDGDGDG